MAASTVSNAFSQDVPAAPAVPLGTIDEDDAGLALFAKPTRGAGAAFDGIATATRRGEAVIDQLARAAAGVEPDQVSALVAGALGLEGAALAEILGARIAVAGIA